MYAKLILLLCATTLVLSSSPRVTLDKKETISVPDGWRRVSAAPKRAEMKLLFGLKQANMDKLKHMLLEVSDPKSEKYGDHLSVSEITSIVAPSAETQYKVSKWLKDNGITYSQLPNKDWIKATVTVSQAERLLNNSFHVYQHPESKTSLLCSVEPHTVPAHIADHLDIIQGPFYFPQKPSAQPLSVQSSTGQIVLNPTIIRKRYNISSLEIGGNKNNKQAVTEFSGNYFEPGDIIQFFQQFWPSEEFNHTVTKIVGENRNENPSSHASQDIEYIMGVAPNVPTWYWSMNGVDFWSDLNSWMTEVSTADNVPFVHAISYDSQGEGPSEQYRERINGELVKMGLRGLSILVAAGDAGTGCNMCWYYEPSFPASSPYVTSVGGTTFAQAAIGHERATTAFPTGGGFSWSFEQPDYQTSHVTHFFATQNANLPDSHFFNRNGRGYPDIAAVGENYQVVVNGLVEVSHGTAASTSTVAAIFSLLNEVRLDHGKATLGFLNPFLYSTSSSTNFAFYDVTEGNNHYGCCGFSGFTAASGWDPVSGLGTPNYEVLYQVVKKMQ